MADTILDTQTISLPERKFDDTNYYTVLGKVLVVAATKISDSPNSLPYINGIKSTLKPVLQKISIDEIVEYLSPSANQEYAILAEPISQSIRPPSPEVYLRLLNAGFDPDKLGDLAIQLITNESQFLAHETQIFAWYFNNYKTTGWGSLIKHKILENPAFSYEFIMSYLKTKYPKLFDNIQWTKLAIAKGAIDIIHKYNLKLTNDEIKEINKTFCTMENINLYKSLSPYKVGNCDSCSAVELFKDIKILDFIAVNKITDSDHHKVNYIKYLGNLQLDKPANPYIYRSGWSEFGNNVRHYHPDLVRQLLDYVHIDSHELAVSKISFAEKMDYIKRKLQTKEYNTQSIVKFIKKTLINRDDTIKGAYNLAEIELALSDIGVSMPWAELLKLHDPEIDKEIKWSQVSDIFNINEHRNSIRIYIRFLRNECSSATDWTPNIQMEYWQIFTTGDKKFMPQDRDALIRVLPLEILRDVPIEIIWSYRLYRHDSFHKIINGTDDNSKALRIKFAEILKRELASQQLINANFDTKDNNYELGAIGQAIIRFYGNAQDIHQYFSVPGIAEAIHKSGSNYNNLSVDTLLGLITLTSNNTIIPMFRSEIERKLKAQAEQDKRNEFAALFLDNMEESDDCSANNNIISKAVTRLVNAVSAKPVRYWSEDDYKFVCEKGFISAEILREFKRTQPVPHPDWNWRTLTILLGADQTILAYPDLSWQTPVYFRRDSDWSVNNITWEYLENHTQLFSTDNEIWTKFSTKLPIDFILERPNYRFLWHSIIARPDFKITHPNWPVIKSKLRTKDLALHPNRYSIELIAQTLDLGWDIKTILNTRVIPFKYLPRFLKPSIFTDSVIDFINYSAWRSSKADKEKALSNFKCKLILTALVDEMDELKLACRTINYLFGDRPHLEKIILGFATNGLLT